MKTILSKVRGEPLKSWTGLFDLYQNADGTFRAELGSETSQRSLLLTWKSSKEVRDLTAGLMFIAAADAISSDVFELPKVPQPQIMVPLGSSNIGDIHLAALELREKASVLAMLLKPIVQTLQAGLQDLVAIELSERVRSRAKRELSRKFEAALDILKDQGLRKPHRNALTVKFVATDGTPREMPLAWAALEVARQMVEENQELPSKRALRERVKQQFPKTGRISASQWAASFREAGLTSLDRAKTW